MRPISYAGAICLTNILPKNEKKMHKKEWVRRIVYNYKHNCSLWKRRFYLKVLSRSFTEHHLRYGGWINFEFSKRGKHLGWAIKTIYKKQSRGMLKRIPLDPRFK